MTTARARLPYLNKDYLSIRRELIARIPQLTDRWTDFNDSDLGIVLLDLFAGVGDMLAYYLDAQAAECYLPRNASLSPRMTYQNHEVPDAESTGTVLA